MEKPSPTDPSSPAVGAANNVAWATAAAAATSTAGGLLQRRAHRGRPRTRAVDQPHLDCPRCGSAHTRFRGFMDRAREKPQYFCSSCQRRWTRGAVLRQSRKQQPQPHASSTPPPPPALLVASATHQASLAAGFSGEPSLVGNELEGSGVSAFLDWIDQFLQTRMQEDFKAAFCGGSEERDGCGCPPSLSDGEQEPEHKLQQQQQLQQQRSHLLWNGEQGQF